VKKPVLLTAAMVTAALAFSLTVVPAQAQVAPEATSRAQATAAANLTPEQNAALLKQIKDLLPADYQSRSQALEQKLGLDDSAARNLVQQAINPGDYQCATTPLIDWVTASLKDMSINDLLNVLVVLQLPTYYSLAYESDSTPQTFGVNGEYSTTLEHTFKDLKRFWNLPTPEIQLVAMHGSILTDPVKAGEAAQVVYGLTDEQAAAFGELSAEIFDQPQFDFGNHPIFTFNSVSYASGGKEDFPGRGVLPNKIVMGDGVMDGLKAVGLGDVAPQAILAHEFGHQVQYAYGQMDSDLTGPEASRRTELMADAYSAYFLTHPQGGHLLWKRVADFETAFSDLGDCAFSDPGHHGTPNQRMRAAEWGYHLANDAQQQGHIIHGPEFVKLFDAALPSIVAPDAG
jgi:hypothetical protein